MSACEFPNCMVDGRCRLTCPGKNEVQQELFQKAAQISTQQAKTARELELEKERDALKVKIAQLRGVSEEVIRRAVRVIEEAELAASRGVVPNAVVRAFWAGDLNLIRHARVQLETWRRS